MIRLQGLSSVFRTAHMETLALDNTNIHIRKGEFVAVMAKLGQPNVSTLQILMLTCPIRR